MGRRKKRSFNVEDAVDFLNYLKVEKPLFPVLIALILLGWAIERWVFSFSNWVPLVVAVWATIQVLLMSFSGLLCWIDHQTPCSSAGDNLLLVNAASYVLLPCESQI